MRVCEWRQGIKVKGFKVKGGPYFFVTEKVTKRFWGFCDTPRPPVARRGLRLRPRNSILRHSWALNGSGNLKLRAKVKTAWQVRDGKVKDAWQVRGG